MASAQQHPGHHFHDVNSSGSARVQLGDHYGDNNFYPAQRRPKTSPAPFSNVPFPRDPDFVDRESITIELEKRLKLPAARVALVGLGGVGKSQLAIEYAHRTRETSPGTFVLWLHASSPARFEQSVRDVLDHLMVPGRNEPQANLYRLLRTWLRDAKGGRTWLLILDNADDPRFLVEPPGGITQSQEQSQTSATSEERCIDYFPACGHGALLVTTRSQDAVTRVMRPDDIVYVEPMAKEQACALLEKRLGENMLCDQAELCELSKRLDYMPLALAQAASYIRQKAPRCSVHEYLEKLDKSGRSELRLLSRDDGDSRRDRDARNSILLTWQISFEYINQTRSTAADLLALMSFFDRQAIPEELLHDRHAESTDIEAHIDGEHSDEDMFNASDSASESESDFFDDDVQILRSYSFITLTADPSAFEMHRLVQLATQRWLEVNKRLECWGAHFVRTLNDFFPLCRSTTLTSCRRLYPHALMVQGIKLTEQDAILRQISLLNRIGQHAFYTGAFGDAESMAKLALHAQIALSERDVDKSLRSMQILGAIYGSQYRLDEAEHLLQDVLPLAQRTSEQWHMTFMSIIAKTYALTDRLEEAQRLQLACLELCQKIHGEEADLTLQSMVDMSYMYESSGRYEEAETLLVRVLDLTTRLNWGESWTARLAMVNLAIVYHRTERFKEAEKLQVHVLGETRSDFGDDHPSTLKAMEDLSHTLRSLGQLTSAVELLGDCANMSLHILGPDHPLTRNRCEWVEYWKQNDRKAQAVLAEKSGT